LHVFLGQTLPNVDLQILFRARGGARRFLIVALNVALQICCMGAGARVGFFSGDVLKLVSDDIPRYKLSSINGSSHPYTACLVSFLWEKALGDKHEI
jgi:hypothetical protein